MTSFQGIKVIGFDLDQTLYPKSPAIDQAIQQYIYEKIAAYRNCDIQEAAALFNDLYKAGRGLSGSQTVAALGVPHAKEIIQEALEKANIAETLSPDKAVTELLARLKKRYPGLDLITGSDISNTRKKMRALGIAEELFTHSITADEGSKSDGSAYRLWLSYYAFPAEQFLYIGDRVMSDYEVPKQLGIKSILVNIAKPDPTLDALQLSSLLEIERYV